MVTVLDIVTAYLTDNGYDGLYTDECGCLIGDLAPCDGTLMGCMPGYKGPCDCGDHDWHIGATREDLTA